MVERHFAWFVVATGHWIGEWQGHVPAPIVPAGLIGEARLELLNAWTQQVQRGITPFGSAYETLAQEWDLDAWDDCPAGGAVCLDVTLYDWPVGDFAWAVFDGVDRILDFRESRAYIQVCTETMRLDATMRSSRPLRSQGTKRIADITGTPLAGWLDHLHGRFVRRDGRLVFDPDAPTAVPEIAAGMLIDRTPDLVEGGR